jgi:hypothetical protein
MFLRYTSYMYLSLNQMTPSITFGDHSILFCIFLHHSSRVFVIARHVPTPFA